MQIGDGSRIPNFLSAKTPKALRKKMIRQNAKKGNQYHYYQIVWTGEEWVAWFVDQSDDLMDDIVNKKR